MVVSEHGGSGGDQPARIGALEAELDRERAEGASANARCSDTRRT